MSRTEFVEFDTSREKTISPEKLKIIEQWYQEAQGDEDKAGSMEDSCFYEGYKSALVNALALILDMPTPEENQL